MSGLEKFANLSRIRAMGITFTSAFFSWVFYLVIAFLFRRHEHAFLATVFLLSFMVHEGAHWIAIQGYGLKSNVVFVGLAAANILPSDDTERLERFEWHKAAVVAMTGIMGNVAVMMGC